MNIFKRLYRTVLTHLTDKEFTNDAVPVKMSEDSADIFKCLNFDLYNSSVYIIKNIIQIHSNFDLEITHNEDIDYDNLTIYINKHENIGDYHEFRFNYNKTEKNIRTKINEPTLNYISGSQKDYYFQKPYYIDDLLESDWLIFKNYIFDVYNKKQKEKMDVLINNIKIEFNINRNENLKSLEEIINS